MIFQSSFSERKKINLMTSIFGWEKWSWRVVGITQCAIDLIHKHKGHRNVVKLLRRDHFFKERTETYREMVNKLYPEKEWWNEFWDNDRTILVSKEEHDKKNSKKFKYKEINWELGYFPCASVVGFRYAERSEGNFILENFSKTK